MPTAPKERSEFKVAVICALTLEADYVLSMFDVCWEDQGKRYGKAVGDQNTYNTGVIGNHFVVLVHLPSIGSVSSAISAANLRSSFPGIQLALLVGVCGAVPLHPETGEEIILGDVVISTAMTQYDFGRQYVDGFERKKEIGDSLGRASPEIRSLIGMLQTHRNRQRLTRNLQSLIAASHDRSLPVPVYPGVANDQLYESSYAHVHHSAAGPGCDQCKNGLETCSRSCEELGCEADRLVLRNRHSSLPTPRAGMPSFGTPIIHFGRFGSANTTMKSAVARDTMATTDKIAALEMEGAGVWEQHPTIAIKAACDYADSHKPKRWQRYAAAVAAACLKVVLEEWVATDPLMGTSSQDESTSALWHMPFEPIPGFVGRATELERLKQSLLGPHSQRTVSVVGLGGVGKSRLAQEVASQIRSENPQISIFWVQATTQLTFENDIREIGKKLGIPGMEDQNTDFKSLVQQRLSHQHPGQWLLILDNADDETLWGIRQDTNHTRTVLAEYLPKSKTGSVLITTRVRRIAHFLAGKEVIQLHCSSSDEAIEIFTQRSATSDQAADRTTILTLVEKLDCLPLAVTQAASFVNMTQCSVHTYLTLLDEPETDVIELLSEDFHDQSRYSNATNPVATTWLISFHQIKRRNPLAVDLLSFMACLDEQGVPLSILPAAASKVDRVKALADLTGHSFVTKRVDTGSTTIGEDSYGMHRLVRLAARSWLKKEGLFLETTKCCISQLLHVNSLSDDKQLGAWKRFLPHAQHLCNVDGIKNIPERYDLLELVGKWLLFDGKYDQAEQALKLVLDWRESTSQHLYKEKIRVCLKLSEVLSHRHAWLAAEQYIQRALTWSQEYGGLTDREILDIKVHLGWAYTHQCRYTEAEAVQMETLKLSTAMLGPKHPKTLEITASLAYCLQGLGRTVEAEELMLRVLESRAELLGSDHSLTLDAMSNLATIYKELGRWTEAGKLFQHVLQTRLRLLGPEHPITLLSMTTLVAMYQSQSRWAELEELALQTLDASARIFPPEHPFILNAMSKLADAYLMQGRLGPAEELALKTVDLGLKNYGPENRLTSTSMVTLVSIYRVQYRYTEAEAIENRLLETQLRLLGPDHPDTLQTMENRVVGLGLQQRHVDAEELLARVLETRVRVQGPTHPATLRSRRNFATVLRNQGRHDEAIECLSASMDLTVQVYGPENPWTLAGWDMLARWRAAAAMRPDVGKLRLAVEGLDAGSSE